MIVTSLVTVAVLKTLTSTGVIKEPKFLKTMRDNRAAKSTSTAK